MLPMEGRDRDYEIRFDWGVRGGVVPFWMAFLHLSFSVFSSFSERLEFLSNSLAANFKLNKCSENKSFGI